VSSDNAQRYPLAWPPSAAIELSFRRLAKTHHPDAGGGSTAWNDLCEAKRQALDAVGGAS
jgi:hypothetical protein